MLYRYAIQLYNEYQDAIRQHREVCERSFQRLSMSVYRSAMGRRYVNYMGNRSALEKTQLLACRPCWVVRLKVLIEHFPQLPELI